MSNEKIENLLNLSLEATMEERDKSLELNVGYDKEDKTWELIVKYHGDLERVASERIKVELLTAGFAIVTIPQSLIEAFADLEEVEYIEKPKRLFFNVSQGKIASCILPVTIREPYLSGQGVLVAIIDSGISYAHMDFRNEDGTTRIVSLWDQSIEPNEERGFFPPKGFSLGVEFTSNQINEALEADALERERMVPSRDISGHGTAVAGIAAGNGRASDGANTGVAPKSELIIVKLGAGRADGFPKTTELMRALTYVVNQAVVLGKAVAINLSFGNTYGSHDGTSLLERFIDNIAEIGENVICVGSGNEGAAAGHVSGNLVMGQNRSIELAIAPYEATTSVQIWKNYVDTFSLLLTSPSGQQREINVTQMGTARMTLNNTELLIYVGAPTPYSVNQEIFIDFLPTNTYLTQGVWTFTMVPQNIVTGFYSFYLPSEVTRSSATRFYLPNPNATLTIPSTASKVITIGAYDTVYDAYADFSGRGYLGEGSFYAMSGSNLVKPELVAPGVNIVTTAPDNVYDTFTGTSFATPFVTGSAALLLEWGIAQGNDPYLYGEKIKAYLIRGARKLPGYETFPNPQVGWGALCVADSLPR